MLDETKRAEWLTKLVMHLAGGAEIPPNLKLIDTVEGDSDSYEIYGVADGKPLVTTDAYRIFVARLPNGQFGLMKISLGQDQNSILQREERILKYLSRKSDEIDAQARRDGEKPYEYCAQFPKLIETLDADGRLALILGYDEVIRSYKAFVPLSIIMQDRRIDFQSAVWVLGKLLRLLDFLHRHCEIASGRVEETNILLEPEEFHAVFMLDFSDAVERPTSRECLLEVADAARLVWYATGGDEKFEPPYSAHIMSETDHTRFVAFLEKVMSGKLDALTAHRELYELANMVWQPVPKANGDGTKRPWYKFITYPK